MADATDDRTLLVAGPMPHEIAEIRLDAEMWRAALAFARPVSRAEAATLGGLPRTTLDDLADRLLRLGLLAEAQPITETEPITEIQPEVTEGQASATPAAPPSSASDSPITWGLADGDEEADRPRDETSQALRQLIAGVKDL